MEARNPQLRDWGDWMGEQMIIFSGSTGNGDTQNPREHLAKSCPTAFPTY